MAFYKSEDEIREGLFGSSNSSTIPVKSTSTVAQTAKPVVEINYVSSPVVEETVKPTIETAPVVEVQTAPVVEVASTPVVEVASTPAVAPVVNNAPAVEAPIIAPIAQTVPAVQTSETQPDKPAEVTPEVKEEPKHLAAEVKEKVDAALKIATEEEKAKMAEEAAAAEAARIAAIDKHSIEYLKINDIDVESGINILGDLETYNSMLKQFHKTSKDIFGKLIEYKATKDTEKYAEQSYYLKNNANYFGFVKLCEYAKDHELKAKDNDFNYISEHFKEYDDELMRIVDVLNEYFG